MVHKGCCDGQDMHHADQQASLIDARSSSSSSSSAEALGFSHGT
jgi:hypothetical protein